MPRLLLLRARPGSEAGSTRQARCVRSLNSPKWSARAGQSTESWIHDRAIWTGE